MKCTTCGSVLEAVDRFCPACRMPNFNGRHHPRFGPADHEPPPLFRPRVLPPGARPCPRCEDGIHDGDHYCRSCGLDVDRLAPPPPEGRTVGVWTTPGPGGMEPYQSLHRRTAALLILLALISACGLALVGVTWMLMWHVSDRLPVVGRASSQLSWAVLQRWCTGLSIGQAALAVLTLLVAIAWTRRADRNLPSLDVIGLRVANRWAVLGWIIPGACPFVAKRVLDDTWRASDPDVLPWSPAWRGLSVPTANHLWWMGALVALPVLVLAQVQLAIVGPVPTTDLARLHEAQMSYLMLAVAQLLVVFAALLLAKVIGSIGERQDARVEVLGPAPVQSWRRLTSGEPEATSTDATSDAAEAPAATGTEPVLLRAVGVGSAGRY